MLFPPASAVQRSAEIAVRTALYDLLSSRLALRVYDHVPEGQDLDYVVVGNSTSNPWNTWSSTGEVLAIDLRVQSQYDGAKSASQALADIERFLTTDGLNLQDNFRVCVLAVGERRLARNPDGKTRTGSVTVTVKVQDLSVK